MSVKDQNRVRDRQTDRQAQSSTQGLVEWDHRASWDINSWSQSVTPFSYHHLFSLNSKTLPEMFFCKTRASSFKKLQGCYVQMKCRSTEESSVCLQNSHRIHSLYKTPLYVGMMIIAIQDAACFVDLYVCFSFSRKHSWAFFENFLGLFLRKKYFLQYSEQKGDVRQNVQASVFHTEKVNGDLYCQAPKRTIKVVHITIFLAFWSHAIALFAE